MFPELLPGPLSGVSIALHCAYAVPLQGLCKLRADGLWRERRSLLSNRVEHYLTVLMVSDSQRHAVLRAATRVYKTEVPDTGNGLKLEPSRDHGAFDCLNTGEGFHIRPKLRSILR